MFDLITGTDAESGLTAEDIQAVLKESRRRIKQLELAGDTRAATQHRIRTAIGLWTLAERNNDSRQGKVLRRRAVRWSRRELTDVDPKSLAEAPHPPDERDGSETSADQVAGDPNGDGDAVEAIAAKAREPQRSIDELYGDELRASLRRVVEQIELAVELDGHGAFDDQTAGNFLFHGRPGTGKTHAAEAVCKEIRERNHEFGFLPLKGADLKSHLYGKSQQRIEAAFRWADENGPTVVFIDEIEEVATREGHEETQAMTNTLLSALDGTEAYENVVVIAATNLPEDIDPALRQRFGRGTVEFGEPPTRIKPDILYDALTGPGVTTGFDTGALETIDFAGLVGRELVHAAQLSIVEAYRGSVPVAVPLQAVREAVSMISQQGIEADSQALLGEAQD